MAGALDGVRVLEFASIGPVPFCGMLLADMGADVLRIDRDQAVDLGLRVAPRYQVSGRGRRSVAANLTLDSVREALFKLIDKAEVLIEGFRPGVMEKLGFGPDICLARNPRLVYGRITGWGQAGPLAHTAGHDINYVAMTGALHAIGPADGPPSIPLNLLGDFAGGAAYSAFGIMCALRHAAMHGVGQVVDTAMTDGVSSLMSMCFGRFAAGDWADRRGANVLDGGVPWYAVYPTADNEYIAIGAIEQRFYDELIERMGLDRAALPPRADASRHVELRKILAARFKEESRDTWCERMEGSDACFSPVLSLTETLDHPYHTARQAFIDVDGVRQPAPAPRLSRTPGSVARPAPRPGEDGAGALLDWGFSDAEISSMSSQGLNFENTTETQ
ncbi:CaiB/BaiF CoA-transferase family protein [Paraburkholderia nemoris]|uniref:CaiB/BaiF CoA transferase family protein n=1 Tax=Paraburkholderia nemoris TaxID=2793076 RepID=UPI0038BA29AE